jgi:hypothetical protein
MAEKVTEAKALKAQLAVRADAAELEEFARSSAGGLPLAKPTEAQVESLRPAGATVIEQKGQALRLAEEYGEGIYDPRVTAKIGTDEYKKAFRAYLRTPVLGSTPQAALRTLQEGADTSGGLIAA